MTEDSRTTDPRLGLSHLPVLYPGCGLELSPKGLVPKTLGNMCVIISPLLSSCRDEEWPLYTCTLHTGVSWSEGGTIPQRTSRDAPDHICVCHHMPAMRCPSTAQSKGAPYPVSRHS